MADPFHVFGLNLVLFDYLLFPLFSFVIGLIKSFVLMYLIRENVVGKKWRNFSQVMKTSPTKILPDFYRKFSEGIFKSWTLFWDTVHFLKGIF